MRSAGRRVWGWRWPFIRWARRHPYSRFGQFVWNAVDALEWHRQMRRLSKLSRGAERVAREDHDAT